MFSRGFLLLGLVAKSLAYTPDALADQILPGTLPGSEKLNLNFNQFSGYLTVGGSKNMHYWLVESMNSPSTDPIAFWTNGGPGCSGLLGFFTEQGPFRPNSDMSLSLNDYAWNKIANMVFIESPCGVGFSYSDQDEANPNDESTAADNYALIQAFMARFPEFSKNDLYITSESYGGHYMPTLAKKIVDENTAGVNPKVNFKGFAVGNPFTTTHSATLAMPPTYWGHQLIPKPTWDEYSSKCTNNKVQTLFNLAECEDLLLRMMKQIGNLNPYALDYPVCTTSSAARFGRAQRRQFLNHVTHNAELKKMLGGAETYEPCASDYTLTYLNLPEVKKAIHVNADIKWEECAYGLRYDQKDSMNSMVPIYQYLIDGNYGLNILVYSGDDDSVCATVGTQDWIWEMGYNVSGRMWQTYSVNEQTAGYFTKWENTKLGFVTVRNAGHEVPAYTPEVALYLFSEYLAGSWTNA